MTKKKILTLALCVAMTAILAVGTLAYFTDTDKADNVFTVGNVKIELTETKWEAEGEEAADVYPGEALPKNPNVTNNGDNPCFVRLKVEGLDVLGEDNMITYETNYVTGALHEDWKLYDGYFYYKHVLPAGESTKTDLFDQIRIPTSVTNGFDGSYDVVVSAEAVQAQGAKPSFSAVQAMTVEEIAAWFTTCMTVAE